MNISPQEQQFLLTLGPELSHLNQYILENNLEPSILYLVAKNIVNVTQDTGFGTVSLEIANKEVKNIKGTTNTKIGYSIIKNTE